MNTYKEVQGSVLWGRGLVVIFLLALIGSIVYQVILAGQRLNWILVLVTVLLAFILANFWQMTIAVNSQAFTVGFGIIKKRFPLSEITSWQPTEYNWLNYGGWGIRFGSDDSRAYSAKGKTAIALQTPKRKYLVTTSNPEKLCQVIAQFKKG